TERADDVEAFAARRGDARLDLRLLFIAGRVRVETADRDPGTLDRHLAQGAIHGLDSAEHLLLGDLLDRLPNADVKRDVRDADISASAAKAQHQQPFARR